MIALPHWPPMQGNRDIKLGLSRIEALLAKLGNPHYRLPPVVHVAGTNGKGSTIAFLRAILEASGYRVHQYTSPHLIHFNERILLAGEPVSDDYLHEILEECRIATTDIPVTFFEGTTVAALLAFAEVEADIVLLETGLGGRLDATNVIDAPLLTVITPISLDHCDYLGNTLSAIAKEKGGIIKPSVPCVVSKQPAAALRTLERIALKQHAPLYSHQHEWFLEEGLYTSPKRRITLPPLSLQGGHQTINAATALACIDQLQHFDITSAAIEKGLTQAVWPGRMQYIREGKLPSLLPPGSELWIDGGHNIAAAAMLKTQIQQWEREDDLPLIVLFAMTGERDVSAFLKPFASHVSQLYACPLEEGTGAVAPEQILQAAQNLNIPATTSASLESALNVASQGTHPIRILITGSLYLAGTALAHNNQ